MFKPHSTQAKLSLVSDFLQSDPFSCHLLRLYRGSIVVISVVSMVSLPTLCLVGLRAVVTSEGGECGALLMTYVSVQLLVLVPLSFLLPDTLDRGAADRRLWKREGDGGERLGLFNSFRV